MLQIYGDEMKDITLEDAIDELSDGCKKCADWKICDTKSRCYKARKMAIEALIGANRSYLMGADDALTEVESKIKRYGAIWMEFTAEMTVEQVVNAALKAAKEAVLGIVADVREGII